MTSCEVDSYKNMNVKKSNFNIIYCNKILFKLYLAHARVFKYLNIKER